MTQFQERIDQYWKYYLALEARFLETEKYVEFDLAHNGKVYSMEYMMLLQAVCSEIDVVGKVYAGLCDKNFKATKYTGLNEWWYYITKDNSSLTNETVAFRHAENLQPWKNYRVVENKAEGKRFVLDKSAKTPVWWNAYNGAKHSRTSANGNNYKNASFRNVLMALSALYILESTMLEGQFDADKDIELPMRLESKLFEKHLRFYTDYISAVLG